MALRRRLARWMDLEGPLRARLEELEADLAAASTTGDREAIASLSRDLRGLKQEIESDFEELERVSTELEKHEREFDRQLGKT